MGRKRQAKPLAPLEADPVDDDLAQQLLDEFEKHQDQPGPPSDQPQPPSDQPQPPSEQPLNQSNGPKRNRRKEKLAQREAQRKTLIETTRAEAATKPDLRKQELMAMKSLVEKHNLSEVQITPDGHCLFASIADQLNHRLNLKVAPSTLRVEAAEYIKKNKDDFVPYMLDETTGELRQVDEYCDSLLGGLWGGEMEIMALAKVYDCSVTVFFAQRTPLAINSDARGSDLKIAYYSSIYGLGAHYNSLRDHTEPNQN